MATGLRVESLVQCMGEHETRAPGANIVLDIALESTGTLLKTATTLGVRIEIDFDGFFQRADALDQLQAWRQAIATSVLGLPSPFLLQLQRVTKGSLDLEFSVEGISDRELQERISQQAQRLAEILQDPLLEVRIGQADSPERAAGGMPALRNVGPSPRDGLPEHPSDLAMRLRADYDFGHPGQCLSPAEEVEARLRSSLQGFSGQAYSQAHQREASPVPAHSRVEEMEARLRAVEASYGPGAADRMHIGADLDFQDHAPARGRAASRASVDQLNHPTTAQSPSFLREDSHWTQSNGQRIREQQAQMERERKLQEQEEIPRFHARPVPVSVSQPRFDAMHAAALARRVKPDGRPHSADGAARRARSPNQFEANEDQPPPFRARKVPWRCSAPMYSQLLAEERQSRQERQRSRSLELLRSSSLPPRLQAAQRRARYAEREGENDSPNRPPRRPRSAGRFQGSSPEVKIAPAPTTEVPDFASRHERLKHQLERRKYLNRYVTQPEPFVFHAPSRSQMRQLPMKDPTQDWRFARRHKRPASAGGATDRPGGRFSIKALERPSYAVPPRATEKFLMAQQATQRRLQERREKEERERQQLEQAHEVPTELKLRVQQAVGPIEPLEERVERIVLDKRQGLQRIQREKVRDLQRMQERVNRRPLLMEQADSLVRARRRALFRVRNTLKEAGVPDVDSHFREEELDEFDKGAYYGDVDPGG
eukprot:TRINITY_DN29481_c0_g1_i1.p1 TRINITY_DN29481_c0_g1~~TRINITY_DN29481_c0_g1_i1.p1  ORF type:complete len:713 (+),score=102.14 TRINITY_DN29481_c0_g1_i1:52-2190(+)